MTRGAPQKCGAPHFFGATSVIAGGEACFASRGGRVPEQPAEPLYMLTGEGVRTKRATQLPKTTAVDPAELRALRARTADPAVGEGTPLRGMQPSSRATRRASVAELRALVVASSVARSAQKRMKLPAIRMGELIDGLPTEQMTPLQITRAHESLRLTVPKR